MVIHARCWSYQREKRKDEERAVQLEDIDWTEFELMDEKDKLLIAKNQLDSLTMVLRDNKWQGIYILVLDHSSL